MFSWFSIIGIALGVAAIIIVMSIMNGFRIDLTKRMLGINSHLNIYSSTGSINNNSVEIIKNELDQNDFNMFLRSIETNGLLIKNEVSKGVLIRGYDYKDKYHYLYNAIK